MLIQPTSHLTHSWRPRWGARPVEPHPPVDTVELSGVEFSNPLSTSNLPDPGVSFDGDYYWLTTTSGNGRNAFPIRRSRDLVEWEPVGHAFPEGERPQWASGDFWAPEIHPVDGEYRLYYTARHSATGRLAVGVAGAVEATGPWTDLGEPLVLDPAMSMIDPTFFRDEDGRQYLYWKADGNAQGKPTPIYVQELSEDGTELVGERTEVLTNDQPWEGDVTEGPFMVKRGGFYYLFYSGNAFYDDRYAVGVARSTSPTGPFEKYPDPILVSNDRWWGPGHGSVVEGPDGEDYFLYHAWEAGRARGGNPRMLLMEQIEWEDGWPRLGEGSPSSA